MDSQKRQYKLNKCTRDWSTLIEIEGDSSARFCDSCDKNVHWCNTEHDVQQAVNNNWCIAAENQLVFGNTHASARPPSKDAYYLGEIQAPYKFRSGEQDEC